MRQNIRLALGLAVSAAAILSVSAGPELDQSPEEIPVAIVIDPPSGLKGPVELEVGVNSVETDETTGERTLQYTKRKRYALGQADQSQFRQELNYSLKEGQQYQFTADVATESGKLLDFTYTVTVPGVDNYGEVALSPGKPVVLTLKKTPRAEKIGTFFDVTKEMDGGWSIAYYLGPDQVGAAIVNTQAAPARNNKKQKQ